MMVPSILPPGGDFDYQVVADVADETRAIAARIRERLDRSIIETGRDLLAAKAMLEHGMFGQWISAEFGWTDRTARNFMSAAQLADSKSEIISVLPAAAIYKLAAPSTPEEVKDRIISRLEAGERLSAREVSDTVAEARRQVSREKAATKASARRRRNPAADARRAQAAEWERKRQEEEEKVAGDAAQECICLLKNQLGSDFERFVELAHKSGWKLYRALRQLQEGGAA